MSLFAEVQPESKNPLSFLSAIRPESKILRRAITTYALSAAVWEAGKKGRKWWDARHQYTVSINSTEDIYDDVQIALLSMMPERNKRALLAAQMRGNRRVRPGEAEMIRPSGYVEAGFVETRRIETFYDGDAEQTFELEGHRIRVKIEQMPIAFKDISLSVGSYRDERIRFVTQGEDGRAAAIRWLETIVASRDVVEAPRLFMLRYGSWYRRTDRPPRALDTVILGAGQLDEIVDDVRTFLSWREDYLQRGWPYHRGYLFHGPPGTGKTSLAHALSAHFGLDMYYVPLKDVEKDASLLNAVSEVPPNSVLLLEDVDVYHAATQRNDDGAGVSLSGLLNALDGVATPNGLIVILTTNDIDKIDEAVIRPGRVDVALEISYIDRDQLDRLVTNVLGESVDVGDCTPQDEVTAAEVLAPFKKFMHDPKLGLDPLREMLDAKRMAIANPVHTKKEKKHQ